MPLADLLTTTDETARSGAESVAIPSTHDSRDADRIDIKGFDIVPLSKLWALLSNQEWNVSRIDAFEEVFAGSDDGPWIHRIPEDFANLLAGLDDGSRNLAASAWARTDELVDLAKRNPPLILQVLTSIVALARRARSLNQALYLWMSL